MRPGEWDKSTYVVVGHTVRTVGVIVRGGLSYDRRFILFVMQGTLRQDNALSLSSGNSTLCSESSMVGPLLGLGFYWTFMGPSETPDATVSLCSKFEGPSCY
ncbi:hypothetical protein TNCV_4138281 [Trichonephila clavipes]|nr:hypothetical protein TNCV_4138281 [Trichonephila clavipes]